MTDKYTWFLIDDPVMPSDHYWVLVADKRVSTPIKAKYHADTGYFEYSTSLDDFYGSYFDDGYIQAWMPIPMFYG